MGLQSRAIVDSARPYRFAAGANPASKISQEQLRRRKVQKFSGIPWYTQSPWSTQTLGSAQIRSRRFLRGALAAITIVISLLTRAAIGQAVSTSPSGQITIPDRITIHGVVLDSAHKPIADALVRLEQKGAAGPMETGTSATGAFVFSVAAGTSYTIIAEKTGLRSRAIAIGAGSPADQKALTLVLEASDATQPSSADGMAFADQPNFTVAGIIDRTAAAGHGSDTSLRTSESLARDAATLKPDTPPAASTSGTASGNRTEAALRAALANAPGSFEANHQLGEFCYHAGHYRDAIPMFETAFQIDPANRGNEYDLAVAQKEAGNFAASRVHAQNLLAHENNANLHSLLGDLDEQTGDSLGAVREYELAVRLDPSEQNYFKWGSELLLHRAVQPAAEVFAKGSAAYPKSARMLAAMGAALFAGGRYDEAAQRLCDASDLNPADSAPYIFLARIDEVAPAPLACVEPKLHRFLDLQPDNARANFYYAMAVWKRQKASDDPRDLQRVEGLLTKATTVDPNYGEAWLQFGILYFIERNYEKAIGFYTKAIEADPQLSEAHYRLGLAYERTAEPAKAKQQFHLHDQIEKQQAAAVERQRSELKQFLVVLGQRPGNRPPN